MIRKAAVPEVNLLVSVRSKNRRVSVVPGTGAGRHELKSVPIDPTARLSLLVLPYDAIQGSSLVEFLIEELSNGGWSRFSAAVAYARASANWPAFVNALEAFAREGNSIELTFGANNARDDPGTDLEVVRDLVTRLAGSSTVICLYHELGRLFHPKVYLFDNASAREALLITGSSNWTANGLSDNVEANLIARLNLDAGSERTLFDGVRQYFTTYWQEGGADEAIAGHGRARRVTAGNLDTFAPLLAPAREATGGHEGDDADPAASRRVLDPAVLAAEALFTGEPLRKQHPLARGHAARRSMRRREPAASVGSVFLQDVPKGGTRWQQGNMRNEIWRDFFGADQPEDLTMIPVGDDGRLGMPETRNGGERAVSSNYAIEMGIAPPGAYPSDGAPIRAVVPVGNRRFVYMLLMPGDDGYADADAVLARFNVRRPPDRRSALIDRTAAEAAWPESPLWAGAAAAQR